MRIIGIDPGLSGAIAVLDNNKVLKIYDIDEAFVNSNNTTREEALSALEVLGINKKSAERLVDRIIKDNLDITVEEIIKETLKNI